MLKVYPLPPPTILFSKQQPNEKKLSVTLRVGFAIVLACLSLDFGFVRFKSPEITAVVKSICAIQTIVISCIIVFCYSLRLEDNVFKVWYSLYVVEYLIIVFVLLFSKRDSLFNFHNDMLFIDSELRIKKPPKLEYIIFIWMGICVLFRLMISIIYCTVLIEYCITLRYIRFMFIIILLCCDFFLMFGFVIYYFLYFRIKVFTDVVSNGNSEIVSCHYLYKSIADIADSIKSVYNSLYVIILFFHTIEMMTTIFYPLLRMNIDLKAPVNIITAMSLVHAFIMVFAPAFAAGLVSAQVDQLRLVLHERLLQERDKKHTADIDRFARYLEVRPLKITIWQVIPLDWNLPVIVINLSVTYLIVLLQFSHKY